MNERQMQFRVGVVVFATMIIGGVLATLNEPDAHRLAAVGPSARTASASSCRKRPASAPNTPVRKNGLLIGRVTSIEDRTTASSCMPTSRRPPAVHQYHVPHVRTSRAGRCHDRFRRRRPMPPASSRSRDGAVVPRRSRSATRSIRSPNAGRPAEISTMPARSATPATKSPIWPAASTRRSAAETEEGRVKRLLDTTEHAMNQFAKTMTSINEIIGDDRASSCGQPLDVPADRPAAAAIAARPRSRRRRPAAGRRPADAAANSAGPERTARRHPRNAHHDAATSASCCNRPSKNSKNLEGFTEPLGRTARRSPHSIVEAVDGLDRWSRSSPC